MLRSDGAARFDKRAGPGHGTSDPPGRIHIFNRAARFFLDNLAQELSSSARIGNTTGIATKAMTSAMVQKKIGVELADE